MAYLYGWNKGGFFNVGFNELNGKDINGTVVDMSVESYYSETALQKFQNILSYLEEMKGTSPCIVIDGFAQFQDEELKRVPISHLFKLLRIKSFFSILIFDERGRDISCNADIIIDMRQGHEEANHYTFYELQITKSTYQTTVLGWHQYKERPYGVEVFPSVHRLLQRRDYLSFVLSNTHQSIVDESYEEYLRSIKDGDMPTRKREILTLRNSVWKSPGGRTVFCRRCMQGKWKGCYRMRMP